MDRLFSYGTLRLPQVQGALFGRQVPTADDTLPGFRLETLTITDPEVIATSGADEHPILRPGTGADVVAGACLELSPAELAAADAYEVDDYVRVEVTLGSGLLGVHLSGRRLGSWCRNDHGVSACSSTSSVEAGASSRNEHVPGAEKAFRATRFGSAP